MLIPFLSHLILDQKYNPQMDWHQLYPETFVYHKTFDFTVLGNASISDAINIQADASFLLTELRGTILNANTVLASFGSQQVVDCTVQILDTGSGKNLFSEPVQFCELFGQAGERTFVLPTPRILKNNSTLAITVTNVNGGAAKFSTCFMGVKLLNRR